METAGGMPSNFPYSTIQPVSPPPLTLIPVIMINKPFHNLQLDWILLFYWIRFQCSRNLVEFVGSRAIICCAAANPITVIGYISLLFPEV